MLSDPVFWVAVSFALFIAMLVYFKVPAMALGALDKRADTIRDELEAAQKLREEAQALLAEYQRKQNDAEKEAEAIVEQARRESELIATENQEKMAQIIERQTALAEIKIAQAEVQAIKDVRNAASELAIEAARQLIAKEVSGSKGTALIDQSIKNLKSHLN